MEIKEIQSIQDLESIGSLEDVIEQLNKKIFPLFIKADSFEDLFQTLSVLKKNWVPFIEGPFVSEQAKYIYCLTELEGESRNKVLGINDECYESVEAAKKWRRKIESYVHPDKGGNSQAFDILRNLYNVMVDDEEYEDD